MATSVPVESPRSPTLNRLTAGPLRVLVSLIVPAITFLVLRWAFIFMRDAEANKLAVGIVALIIGVGGVWALYLVTDNLVSILPEGIRESIRPFVFVGPALVILTVYLVYPVVRTIYLSFMGPRSEEFVGLANYVFALTSDDMLLALRNNVLWLIFVTSFVVSLGLIIAVLVDRIGRWEPIAKSFIFLPMAISAVGASVIWKFVYSFQPIQRPQIGLLNAVYTALGGDPQGWLVLKPWNNFFLIAILIWVLTGFAMVVLSAAIKGVPSELLEASRIDGASEIRIFFGVIIPYIRGTLITITTTVLIMVLKVFDIVFVMTGGQFDTEVIANRMFREMFTFGNFGRSSALAMVLLVAVIPVMIYNVRSLEASKR
ncbi:MAG TPA: sugar ABC transporter permease [Anaerolineales bacterium]|nr:sugar ABC transporter permease [Anaerolineales bacterium]